MEPMIYKPGAYNTPGVYKGSGGIYKGRGVYNDGAGGGSPIPPEYTAYDWIQFDGSGGGYTWTPTPIISIESNKDVIFSFDYQNLKTTGSIELYRIKPGLNLAQVALLEIGNYYNETAILSSFQNGGTYDWINRNIDLRYYTNRSTLRIMNENVLDENYDIIGSKAGAYSDISMINYYLIPFCDENRKLRSYGVKIERYGVTLYEFIPVKENDTGKCGFYDIVNNVFTTFTDPYAFSHWTAGNDS